MEKVTEATLHLEKVTEAMAKCNLSLEYLKVTEAMAKCNLSLNYSQKIFWSDWTFASFSASKVCFKSQPRRFDIHIMRFKAGHGGYYLVNVLTYTS